MNKKGDLFENIPSGMTEELFETLISADGVRVERILSRGHRSPDGFWYDQEDSEFVVILRGSAGLRLENEEKLLVLREGHYVNIGAHVKHRVEWTDPARDTIWLAVHYTGGGTSRVGRFPQ